MTTAPRRLGLDMGKCTGWAIAEGDKLIASGVRDFSIKNSEHPGTRGIRFYNFLITLGRIDEIYYEKIMFTGSRKGGGNWSGDNGELYKGFLMLLNMFAAGYGIDECHGVWPGTLKSEFAGHGHADKADMCATARSLGWKGAPVNTTLYHDEVDAIACLVVEMRRRYNIELRIG